MENNWMDQSVGDIVSKLPVAASLFKAKGIDYCCGGHRLLSTVIKDQGLSGNEISSSLEKEWKKTQQNASSTNFAHMNPSDLSSYIETRHHSYLREALPQVGELLNTVLRAHGKNHPELFHVHSIFGKLRIELEQHLIKEETLLFPLIAQLDKADINALSALSQELRDEHEAAGALIKELSSITSGYQTPPDGCKTYRNLMEKLAALQDDLFEHIHLENNILFKELSH